MGCNCLSLDGLKGSEAKQYASEHLVEEATNVAEWTSHIGVRPAAYGHSTIPTVACTAVVRHGFALETSKSGTHAHRHERTLRQRS